MILIYLILIIMAIYYFSYVKTPYRRLFIAQYIAYIFFLIAQYVLSKTYSYIETTIEALLFLTLSHFFLWALVEIILMVKRGAGYTTLNISFSTLSRHAQLILATILLIASLSVFIDINNYIAESNKASVLNDVGIKELIDFRHYIILPLLSCLFAFNTKSYTLIAVIASCVVLFLSFVKGLLLYPLVALFIAYVLNLKQFTYIKAMILFALISIMFMLSYYVRIATLDEGGISAVETSIFKLYDYSISGVAGLTVDIENESIRQNIDVNPYKLYTPYYNFFINTKLLKADKLYPGNDHYTVISTYTGGVTNVSTFYGTLYRESGSLPIYILNLAINAIFVVFAVYLIYSSNVLYYAAGVFYIQALFLGPFEYYFWHSFVQYGVLILLIFGYVMKRK